MHRGGRACQVVYLIDFDVEREGHIVAHQLEPRVAVKVIDVPLCACKQIIDTDNFVAHV